MAIFVVQKHKQGDKIHYDLRLEIFEVLKSWLLPNGPSLDPSQHRLARQCCEHPITYMHYETQSLEEEAIIWDRGEVFADGNISLEEQFSNGNIIFYLQGKRLKGLFKLQKPEADDGKDIWVLKKIYDEYISYEDILKTYTSSIVSMQEIN